MYISRGGEKHTEHGGYLNSEIAAMFNDLADKKAPHGAGLFVDP
jgi:hypothetical protein